MKLAKLPPDPNGLAEFFQAGLEALGAVCERTWFDRVQVLAEGRAARLWQPDGQLLEAEIRFPPLGQPGVRDAAREVFPGCPLTFRLAEALVESPPCLQRVVLQTSDHDCPPPTDVAERLWRLQYPATVRWRPETPFQADWHFSLLALVRCEIQAIDQHWSLHRVALSLPEGERDEDLARDLELCTVAPPRDLRLPWLAPDPAAWQLRLREALTQELETDLNRIRQRQENYLRRELERIEDYFWGYAEELRQRLPRQRLASSRTRIEERLTAARHEHERRRLDQVQRHEIRVVAHLDAFLLAAERAWRMSVSIVRPGESETLTFAFLPRTRRWLPS